MNTQMKDAMRYHSKGFVTLTVLRTDEVEELGLIQAKPKFVERVETKNTVLRAGRRQLAAALGGNLLTDGFKANVKKMVWGKGGTDISGRKLAVPETATGLIGGQSNVLVETWCEGSMAPGDDPTVIFSGVIGKQTAANGYKVDQLGLVLDDGTYFAVATFGGLVKEAGFTFVLNWTIDLL